MTNSQKGFASILIVLGILLVLGIAGGAYYFGTQNKKPGQAQPITNNQGAFDVKDQIAKDINPDPREIRVEVQQVEGNYAFGNFLNTLSVAETEKNGTPDHAGYHWIAKLEAGRWKVVIEGNGFPKCTETEKYNVPLTISGGCVDNNGQFVKPLNSSSAWEVDLKDVPIYPGAKFLSKENITSDCPENQRIIMCGGMKYNWQTLDPLEKVISWYTEDKSNSGWKLSGGAGAEGVNRFGWFSKEDLRYWINIGIDRTSGKDVTFFEISTPKK